MTDFLGQIMSDMAVGRSQKRTALTHFPKPPPKVDPDLARQKILRDWHTMRRVEYGHTSIDYYHACTWHTCVNTGSIQCLSEEFHLYGCVRSGVHHVCEVDAKCSVFYTTGDGGVYCLFSGRFMRNTIDESRFGGPADIREEYVRPTSSASDTLTLSAASEPTWADKMGIFGDEDVGDESKKGQRKRFSMSVIEKGRDMVKVDEASNVSVRAIEGNCGSNLLELTSDKDVAPSTQPLPPPQPTFVSNSTALIANGPSVRRVWDSVKGAASKDHFSRFTLSDISKIIQSLFDDDIRNRIDTNLREMAEMAALDELVRYYRTCAESYILPCSHVRMSIYRHHVDLRLTIDSAPFDDDLLSQFSAFVYELWRIMLATPYFEKAPNKFKLVNHVLGSLYMLKEPFTLASGDSGTIFTEILPRDEFLTKHLPAQKLLKDWNENVSTRVFSASRVLSSKGVVRGHLEFSKTGVSSGRNTIKDALMSIDSDAEREYVVERLRTAYYEGLLTNDLHVYL